MTTVIAGTAGSGKSAAITERIISDLRHGAKVVLLVPEQRAVRTERELALKCQEAGVRQTELEVLNFRRLCNSFFRRYGGICGKKADSRLKALVMWKAYARSYPHLVKYRDMLASLGRFVPVLLEQADEYRRYGISAAMLDETAGAILSEDQHDQLGLKLRESGIIFAEYETLLKGLGEDALEDLSKVAAALEEHRYFEGKRVYADGFRGFTPDETKIIRHAVRQSEGFTIAFALPEGERLNAAGRTGRTQFTQAAKTYKTIKEFDGGLRTEYFDKCLRPETVGIIADRFGGDGEPAKEERDDLRFAALPEPYECAEFVAADIIAKTRENGAKYSDFAVVYGGDGIWPTVLEAVLEKHGIPAHSQRKTKLRETPLFRLITSVIEIKRRNWESADVLTLLKTGLTPFSPEQVGVLENYLQTWGLRGEKSWSREWEMNPRGYSGSVSDRESLGGVLETVNEIRETLRAVLGAFFESVGKEPVRDTAAALYKALCDLGVKDKSAQGESARNWNAMCDVLDIMVQAFGDGALFEGGMPVKEGLFFDLLGLAVDMTETGAIPAAADEAATGPAGSVEICNTPYVYLYGCNEDVFPPKVTEGSIFSDADKERLEEYDLILSPTAETAICDAKFDFYNSCCGAAKGLTLIRALRSEKGEALNPSPEYGEMRALFPHNREITEADLEEDMFAVQDLPAAREASGLLCGTPRGEAAAQAIGEPFVPGSFRSTPAETLRPEFMKEIFGSGLRLSESSMKKYAGCAFSYACRYALGMSGTRDPEFNQADAGTFVHFILERFFRELGEEGKYPRIPLMTDAQTEERVRGIAEDYYLTVLGEDGAELLGAKIQVRFERLIKSTTRLVMGMVNEICTGDYVPSFFELNISDLPGDIKPRRMELADGTAVTVRGKIDRVDVMEADGVFFFRVIDYKTGENKFDPEKVIKEEIKNGKNMQMPIYMFTLEENGSRLLGKMGKKGDFMPAGILYYPAKLTRKNVKAGQETSEALKNLTDSMEPVGVLLNDEKALQGLGDELKKVVSGIKKIKTRDGDYFSRLREAIDGEIREIATGIMEGRMGCDPREFDDKSPCRYCDYADICRNKKEDRAGDRY